MKATAIRHERDNAKPNEATLRVACHRILNLMGKAGFITEAEPTGSTSIKIGLRMSSFRIDTARLGHNGRTDRWCKSPKGYKRTNIPTWDQRVEFNRIVNKVFDDLGLKANIVSGYYTVRSRDTGARYSWPEGGDRSGNGYSGTSSVEIYPEAEMREMLDSDAREAKHKADTREARLISARASRAKRKLFESAKKVTIAGYKDWANGHYVDHPLNGKEVTHARFAQLLAKLGPWMRRQVKEESVKRTLGILEVGF